MSKGKAAAVNSIGDDTVVHIHYTLRNEKKEVLDSSSGGEMLPYLHGHGNIVAGLENALVGKKVGDKLSVTVEPNDGYGEYDKELCQKVPKDRFPKNSELKVGAVFEASGPEGDTVLIRITDVSADSITVDGNHPLAGQKLFFEVEVMSIRPATKTELEHGHVHPGDGHHH